MAKKKKELSLPEKIAEVRAKFEAEHDENMTALQELEEEAQTLLEEAEEEEQQD